MHSTMMAGATFSLLTLMEGVTKYGYEPIVIIPKKDDYLEHILHLKHIKYYIVPLIQFSYPNAYSLKQKLIYPALWLKKFTTYFKNIKIIKQIALKENISVVHTNVGPIREGHVVAEHLNIPHVWHIREYADKDFNIRYFPNKKFFRKALLKDYVVTITKDLLEYNGLGTYEKAKVIYNGVRKQSEIFYKPNKQNYFLCASRVSEEKGHHEVINAFAKFHRFHSDYKLIILGEGNPAYINSLKNIVNQHSLENYVIFKGFQSNVTKYMEDAKALIVASYAEGFGRMTAEAMFAGCLVIGRNTGGTKEIINTTSGLLFNDINQLENCMQKVAEMSPQNYHDQVMIAQTKCMKNFSEENYISKIVDIYRLAVN